MNQAIVIHTPLTDEILEGLEGGQKVLINGVIYTARDAAHKRLVEAIANGEQLPVDIRNQVIFYAGPTPAKPGAAVGSICPTTSYRMDTHTPALLAYGLKAVIGKGPRGKEVVEALKKYKAVYFAGFAGIGVINSKRIKKSKVVAYDDLGPEAIRRLVVEDFPAIVANDVHGNDIYEREKTRYRIVK